MPHWTARVLVENPDVRRGLLIARDDFLRGASTLGRGAAVASLGLAVTLALAMTQPTWRQSLTGQIAAAPTTESPANLIPASAFREAQAHSAPAAGLLALPSGTPQATAPLASVPSPKKPLEPLRLNKQQTAVANWLSRRYSVSFDEVGRLVQESWKVGRKSELDPTLILAIMGIESSFNPFAQSKVGAQGLMQVMTNLHDKKFIPFGGKHAAFDPLTNLQVGVQVLKECLSMAGDIPTALQYYSGAARLAHDQGYANKVLSEQEHLKNVLAGKAVAVNAANDATPLPVRSAKTAAAATTPTPDVTPDTAVAGTSGPKEAEVVHPVLQQTFGADLGAPAAGAKPAAADGEHPAQVAGTKLES